MTETHWWSGCLLGWSAASSLRCSSAAMNRRTVHIQLCRPAAQTCAVLSRQSCFVCYNRTHTVSVQAGCCWTEPRLWWQTDPGPFEQRVLTPLDGFICSHSTWTVQVLWTVQVSRCCFFLFITGSRNVFSCLFFISFIFCWYGVESFSVQPTIFSFLVLKLSLLLLLRALATLDTSLLN